MSRCHPRGAARPLIHKDTKRDGSAFVSAAHSSDHAREAVTAAVRSVVECLEPPLSSLIRRGDRVLVKVNMGSKRSGYQRSSLVVALMSFIAASGGNAMRLLLIVLALLATISVSGCSSIYRVNPLIKDPTHTAALGLKTYLDPIELKDEPDYATAKTGAPNAIDARNRLQGKLQRYSDVACDQHKGDAFGTESNVSLALSVLTSALAGSAAVVPAILTKSALAAAGAFTNASAAAYNEKIYQQRFIGTILRAAEKSRKDQDALIATRRLHSITDYTIEDAVRDAQEYHLRCSFYAGLVLLSESIEKTQAPPSETQILSRIKTLRDQIDAIDKQMKALPVSRQNVSDQEYGQLVASKFGLLRQVDAELLKLSSASAPVTSGTVTDAGESLKQLSARVGPPTTVLIQHDGLIATVTKAEVGNDKKLHIDVSIGTEKGPPSDEQMKTINDDVDLKQPLIGSSKGVSKDDVLVTKIKSVDPVESLKKMAIRIGPPTTILIEHDGLIATVTKAEVGNDKKLHIDVTISTQKGPPSDEQMKTINDDVDLKDPLLGRSGLTSPKDGLVITKVKKSG